MDSQDQALPDPKPAPQGGGGMSDSRFADLLQDGAGGLESGKGKGNTPSHGWQPPKPEDLQPELPQYEILGLLGRGGMGAVYRARQKSLKREVAIKVLPPVLKEGDLQFAERFKAEAEAMARLEHPGIIAVYDAGQTPGGLLYFVMQYVQGTDVAQMIRSTGRLPPEHAYAITAHVCDALAYAHANGLIHRDIKPANIMVDLQGRVKVADFGLAKMANDSSGFTQSFCAVGSPDFMAPEALIHGLTLDGRVDLYAVGVMLYQMLTGSIPRGAWHPASVVVPGIDPRFDQIILKALQYDREQRHSSAVDLRQHLDTLLMPAVPAPDLQRYSSAQMPKTPPSQPKQAAAPPAKASAAKPQSQVDVGVPVKSKAPLFLGLGAAAALCIGALVMFGGGKPSETRSAVAAPTSIDAGRVAPSPSSGSSAQTADAGESSLVKPDQAKPNPTASTPPVPKPEAPKSAAGKPSAVAGLLPSTEPWQDVLSDPAKLGLSGKAEHAPEGLHFSDYGSAMIRQTRLGKQRDGAVRMKATFGGLRPQLRVRNVYNVGNYLLTVKDGKTLRLESFSHVASQTKVLRDFALASALQPGQDYELELRSVGQTLTAKFNGEVLGTFTDGTHAMGEFGLGITTHEPGLALIKAYEFLDLDASASATPAISQPSAPKLPPGQWVKIFTNFEDLQDWMRKPDSGIKFENGWIRFDNGIRKDIPLPKSLNGNYGVRVRSIHSTATPLPDDYIVLRRQMHADGKEKGRYQVKFHYDSLSIQRSEGNAFPFLFIETPPGSPAPGQEYLLECAAVGEHLIARLGSSFVKMTKNAEFKEGTATLAFATSIRDIEVINLDGLSEVEALKILGVDEKGNDTRAAALAKEMQAMEQSKVVDAASAFPELKVLHEQFVKLTAERVTAPFAAEVAKLNAGYVGGIDRKIAEETAAGHLDGVITLEAEKKLIQGVGPSLSPPPRGHDGPAPGPIPAEDAEGTTANLKALRTIYRAAYAKIEAARVANLKQLTDPLTLRLKQLETELTKQKRIPDAKTVREYREKLADGGSVTPDRKSTPGGAAAKTIEVDKRVPTPPPDSGTKYPRGDDRKAAVWVLDMGGKVTVVVNGISSEVTSAVDLPRGKFTVQKVLLNPPSQPLGELLPLAGLKDLVELTVSKAPTLQDEDLDVLTSLPALTSLSMEYGGLTDAVFTTLAKLRNLSNITLNRQKSISGSGLALIAKLNLLELKLQGCLLSDEGYKNLGLLTHLTGLDLQLANIGDKHLALLEPLKKLDTLIVGQTQVTNAGLAACQGFPNLTKLGLTLLPGGGADQCRGIAAKFPKIFRLAHNGFKEQPLAPQDVATLASFPKLTELTMQQMTDAGMPGLLELPGVSFISLGFSAITDAGLAVLLPHKGLRSLEIAMGNGSVEITDAGLLRLAEMKKLTAVKINCPKITDAGLTALKKLRPDLTVTR